MSNKDQPKDYDEEAAKKHFERYADLIEQEIETGEALTPDSKAEELIRHYYGSEEGEWRQSLSEDLKKFITKIENLIRDIFYSVDQGSLDSESAAKSIHEMTSVFQIPAEERQKEEECRGKDNEVKAATQRLKKRKEERLKRKKEAEESMKWLKENYKKD